MNVMYNTINHPRYPITQFRIVNSVLCVWFSSLIACKIVFPTEYIIQPSINNEPTIVTKQNTIQNTKQQFSEKLLHQLFLLRSITTI